MYIIYVCVIIYNKNIIITQIYYIYLYYILYKLIYVIMYNKIHVCNIYIDIINIYEYQKGSNLELTYGKKS